MPNKPYTGKVTLQHVRLNRGGYDAAGRYYGHGAPIWWFTCDDWTEEHGDLSPSDGTLRARDRAAAKAHIRSLPGMAGCRFYN